MSAAALTPASSRRVNHLAKEAGCEPQDLLGDVLKFGIDFVEQDIRETITGIAEIEAGKGIPHGQVMAEARAIIERHATGRIGRSSSLGVLHHASR